MLFVRHKSRHIEHNNNTVHTLFPIYHSWHLSTTQQNSAVSNLCSTNRSGAPSVVWNPHFRLVHLVNVASCEVRAIYSKVARDRTNALYDDGNFTTNMSFFARKSSKFEWNKNAARFWTRTNRLTFLWTYSFAHDHLPVDVNQLGWVTSSRVVPLSRNVT